LDPVAGSGKLSSVMRRSKGQGNKIEFWRAASGAGDVTSGLTDEILSRILRLLPPSSNYSLVCKRWMRLHGLLRFSIKVQDWTFLETGRMSIRFPNLTDVDLTPAASSVSLPGSSSIFLTHQGLTVQLGYVCMFHFNAFSCSSKLLLRV